MTEDEMGGWHHRLNGHEFEQAPGDGDGQGSLVHCSPWAHKELDTTERLNNKTPRGWGHSSGGLSLLSSPLSQVRIKATFVSPPNSLFFLWLRWQRRPRFWPTTELAYQSDHHG